MKLAVNTSIYDGYDIETVFSSIKKCGFKFFELAYNQGYVGNLNQDLFSDENAQRINHLKNKYDLDTLALGCTMDLATDGLADIFRPRLYFAKAIGAKYINVCTTKLENKEKLIENLKSLREILLETGCILCLENAGDYNFNAFVTLDDGMELLNELGHDIYAINFDPGNMVTYDRTLDVASQSLQALPYCQYFHIKDVAVIDEKFRFVEVGEGLIDYKELVSQLKNKEMPCSLEIPLRIYRELDSTPKRYEHVISLEKIEKTLIASRRYIENIN